MWQKKRINVLLIEDNPSSAAIAMEMIQRTRLDVNITVAIDKEKAINLFDNRQEKPDFVLMDLKRPGIGGLEVLRMIRSKDRGVKVVVLTNSLLDEDRKSAEELGVLAYLSKPKSIGEMNRITFLLKEILLSLR